MTYATSFGAAFAAAAIALTSSAQAQSVDDPFYEGRIIDLSFGIAMPLNTLQDTLTTPNGGGATVQTTDVLDFGIGGRASLGYSQPWGQNSRLIVDITGSRTNGEADVVIGAASETFPGTYDDGFNLPAGWTFAGDLETESLQISVGREWIATGPWRVSAGLRYAAVSQDYSGELLNAGNLLDRTLTVDSENRMYGVFGGVSHYTALNAQTGLRVNADIGLMSNTFDYTYTNVLSGGAVSQSVNASDSGLVVSTQLSVAVEHALSDRSLITAEIGYEGWHGVGNGADTFLDVGGTATTAVIDSDSIGSAYVSIGFVRRF